MTLAESVNFGDVFRAHPSERIALNDLSRPSQPRDWTFGEFNGACDTLARGMLRQGLCRGDRVALLALNRGSYLAALFGAMRAGIVPVPVNVKFPVATLRDVLKDCGAKLAIADAENLAVASTVCPVIDIDNDLLALADPGPFVSVPVAADGIALHLYTSESTGRPKGVLLGHGGQIWNIRVLARARGLGSDAAMLVAAPRYHKNALVASKIALTAGGRMVKSGSCWINGLGMR